MANVTQLTDSDGNPLVARERSTGTLRFALTDEDGAPISDTLLTSLTLTLYDRLSGTTLNDRNHQDVLNLNDVILDGSGHAAWSVQSADHVLVSQKPMALERHRAVFEYTWNSGAQRDWHAFEFLVQGELKVS